MSKKVIRKEVSISKEVFDFDIITSRLRQIFAKRDFNPDAFHYQINIALDQLTIDFWKRTIGKLQQKTIKFYVPNTWKDHFKKKHRNKRWMRWYLKKHPVILKEIKFKLNKTTVFPKVKVPKMIHEYNDHLTYYEAIKHDP